MADMGRADKADSQAWRTGRTPNGANTAGRAVFLWRARHTSGLTERRFARILAFLGRANAGQPTSSRATRGAPDTVSKRFLMTLPARFH